MNFMTEIFMKWDSLKFGNLLCSGSDINPYTKDNLFVCYQGQNTGLQVIYHFTKKIC